MFPNYIWDMATTNKELYLTFDDGPTPEITNWTLDILKQYDAKATFFCIGSNIGKHPNIFKRVIDEGHAIGNHTQNHIKGWTTTTKNYLSEVDQTQSTIQKYHSTLQAFDTNKPHVEEDSLHPQSLAKRDKRDNPNNNFKTALFRPPYGQIKPKQGRKLIDLGYHIIMWDVLSFDWEQNLSGKKCFENVVSKSKPGSIIVFHDSVKASKNMMYALPRVLAYFSKKGYSFKVIDL